MVLQHRVIGIDNKVRAVLLTFPFDRQARITVRLAVFTVPFNTARLDWTFVSHAKGLYSKWPLRSGDHPRCVVFPTVKIFLLMRAGLDRRGLLGAGRAVAIAAEVHFFTNQNVAPVPAAWTNRMPAHDAERHHNVGLEFC